MTGEPPLEPDETFREVSTWQVLLLLVAGAAIGAALLFAPFDTHDWSDEHRTFERTSALLLWAAVICAQTALWLLALAWLLPSFRRAWPAKGKRRELVSEPLISTLVIAVVAFFFVYIGDRLRHWPDFLAGHTWRLHVITALGMLVGLFAAWGIWLTHAKIKTLAHRADLASAAALHDFLIHQSRVKRFLGALGAILGLLVLATAAHRQAVLAYDHQLHCKPTCLNTFQPIDYGYQLVLMYGLFFSILIAAVYLPTHLSLFNVGNKIRDAFLEQVLPNAPEWQDRTANREKLGSLLELDVGPIGRLKASAAILAPLISGLTGLLLT